MIAIGMAAPGHTGSPADDAGRRPMSLEFHQAMTEAYALDSPAIHLGAPLDAGETLADVRVQVALAMLNRHGLVAGATGTGKTKTLQLMAGQLSRAGVPVFIADVKGDLTGMAIPGDVGDARIAERAAQVGITYEPFAHPVDLLSLSGQLGAPVRATVSSFGPLLLARVLDLNATQTSVLSLVFAYCDDHDLPLLDLADLRTALLYLGSDEGKAVLDGYGGASASTLGVILRTLTTLEQDGTDRFFGEPAFEIDDLLRTTPEGEGIVHLLEIADVMDRPRLFSTFLLWMLGQLYEALPEVGDLPHPKLVFFFDEAHLLFRDASKALLEQVELTVRLIRSKGVGVFFVTHSPTDVPAAVLAQLGNRVQHALRVFTPDDADDLAKVVRTFPMTDHFDVASTLTSLGIGEALVTVLSPRGVPTALAPTRLLPPDSLMAPMPSELLRQHATWSALYARYAQSIDRESAHEILAARLAAARAAAGDAGSTSSHARSRTVTGTTRAVAGRRATSAERAGASERKRQSSEAAAARRAEARETRRRERMLEDLGGDLIRGAFGTLFGRSRR
jgi:DNA helicase HerA-like ATPase